MDVGNLNFPYRYTNGQSLQALDVAQSPERLLKRLTIAETSEQAFRETRRQLTEAARQGTAAAASTPLFQELATRLSNLATDLSTPRTLASAGPLKLGPGQGNTFTGIDPNAALNTQSFGQSITAGTVKVTLRVNGGTATTQNVTIDPTQSLNANLQQFNNLTVGGVHPLTASFVDGQVKFQANSTSGTVFNFKIANNTSNFYSAVTNGGVATDQILTGNTTVGTAPGTNFARLHVTFDGNSATITNLTTSSAGLSPYQRATELAAEINNGLAQQGLAQLGLQAHALSNGTLQLTAHNADAAANPTLRVAVSQSGAGQTLGFAGGYTDATTLTGTPALTGPDATLGQLAGQLGLSAVNGSFSGTINGVNFNFSQDESLSSALNDINASRAGVTATYDANSQKVTLTQNQAGPAPIDVQDTRGNFFASLRLTQATGPDPGASATGTLQNLASAAQSVSDTLSLVEAALNRTGPLANNPLLRDLSDALSGLFRPSTDGQLHTFADLGITRTDGQLKVDTARQNDLVSNQPDQVVAAASALVATQVVPLAQAGQQALNDEIARAPLELRLAQQNVHARAEIARLQDRQSLLLHNEVAVDKAQTAVSDQRTGLEAARKRLTDDRVHVPPQHKDLLKPLAPNPQQAPNQPAKQASPAVPTVHELGTQTPLSSGILSFGLVVPPK